MSCLSHTPNRRPGPQPRCVPWVGIKQATFGFAGRCPTHQTIPVRTSSIQFSHLSRFIFTFEQLQHHKDPSCCPLIISLTFSLTPIFLTPQIFIIRLCIKLINWVTLMGCPKAEVGISVDGTYITVRCAHTNTPTYSCVHLQEAAWSRGHYLPSCISLLGYRQSP